MMRNWVFGLITLCGLGLFVAASSARETPRLAGSPGAYRPDHWKTYSFEEVGRATSSEYNLSLAFRSGAGSRPVQARLAFDRRDEKHYRFADITPQGVQLGKVEEDFEFLLGEARPVSQAGPDETQVLLQRRSARVAVCLNQALAATAGEEGALQGPVFLSSSNDSITVSSVRLQPVGEVYFADDFMKAGVEASEWEVVQGDWKVKSLKNPSLSANAFTYEGHSSGRPAITLAGQRFWDHYRFRAAVSGPGCGDVGLIFYYQNPEDYYLFRWSPQAGRGRAARQLCHFSGGQCQVLAESQEGYGPGQWYQVEVQARDQRFQLFIDDTLVFDVSRDSHLAGGRIGLYSDCSQPGCPAAASFDDVEVCSLTGLFEDFSRGRLKGWTTLGGNWQAGPKGYEVRSEGPAHAVTGLPGWKNYRIEADVSSGQAEGVGLLAAYRDEASYLLYRVSPRPPGAHELVRVQEGLATVLQRGEGLPRGWLPGGPNRLTLALDSGVACTGVNGQRQLEAWLGPGLAGKTGLYAEKAGEVCFETAAVQFLESPRPVLSVNPVFAHEKSMANWAAADSDWLPQTVPSETGVWEGRLHRMDFYGDVELALAVEEDLSFHALRMSLATEEETPQAGYHLEVRKASQEGLTAAASLPPASAPGMAEQPAKPQEPAARWTARLLRNDREMASVALRSGLRPRDFRFRRAGSLLLALVNGEAVLSRRDSEPVSGRRIAYQHQGGRIRPEAVAIFSDQAWCYSFRQAITDWRIAAGEWEVTSRWQCDPRWTFFSGHDRRLACIWNKRHFSGDLSVDFATGIKMDRNRGSRYEYARDINVTIGGDGNDLTSGYSFLFGGYENRRTCILRRDKIVAQSPETIPIQSNIHRRWFHIKVARRGNSLLYWIDDRQMLKFEDPDPLPGDQVALWTWDNGIMVAQVRVSSSVLDAQRESPRGPPDAEPACIYP
ncbi:MAG: hypothetical protein HYU36_22040 [Planctomycetes bacterium]|nr:hypothetical protein [Planctomycetota bacterium]